MRFAERLRQLGFETYEAYLQSEHWVEFKKYYAIAGRLSKCAVCDSTPIQLHHHNYDNLGHEKFDDVDPLCGHHHSKIHEWLREHSLYVCHTATAIKAIRREEGRGNPKAAKRPSGGQKRRSKRAAKRQRQQDGSLPIPRHKKRPSPCHVQEMQLLVQQYTPLVVKKKHEKFLRRCADVNDPQWKSNLHNLRQMVKRLGKQAPPEVPAPAKAAVRVKEKPRKAPKAGVRRKPRPTPPARFPQNSSDPLVVMSMIARGIRPPRK